MRVEVMSTGDELLAGSTVDTNGAWVMARVHDSGIAVARSTCVGDDVLTLAGAIMEAVGRGARLLVCCGGLGPTEDDLMAEAASAAAGAPLALHGEARRLLEERLAALGISMSDRQLRQARLPVGAVALANDRGVAPGFRLDIERCAVFCLPGPPIEFRPMVDKHVMPWLAAREEGETHQAMVLKTFGLGESRLADTLASVEGRHPAVKVGYRVVLPEVHLRLRASAPTSEEARALLESAAAEFEAALGDAVFGRDEDTMPGRTNGLLAARGLSLALAESCTGGMLGSLVTSAPGSSRHLLASIVTYANEMKIGLLGVPASLLERFGAVSEECARAMAEGALRATGADVSLAVTGIAGPGGGTAEKPVGTVWFGHAMRDHETLTELRVFPGDREIVRKASAHNALDMLRRRLLRG